MRRQELFARADLVRRIEDAELAKKQALEAGRLDDAARLRDPERQLREQLREPAVARPALLLEVRQRLGIPGSPGEASNLAGTL